MDHGGSQVEGSRMSFRDSQIFGLLHKTYEAEEGPCSLGF